MSNTLLFHKPIHPGTCEWCGKACNPEDTCCSLSCEAKLLRLEKETGLNVLRLLKLWRKHRGRKGTPGEGVLTLIAAEVDTLLKSDRSRRKLLTEKREQKPEA